MRIRAFVVTLGLVGAGVAVANCGSEDGSSFGDGNTADGGDGSTKAGTGSFGGSNDNTGIDPVTGCKKVTCTDLGINCGPAGDGCGGKIDDCGSCAGTETCGGGGTASVCGGSQGCVPRTCDDIGVECGPAGDGCGGTLDCGNCKAPQICGGGGPSKCGGGQISSDGGVLTSDGGICNSRTVCNANECGPVANGCGGLLPCPGCPTGSTCGGAQIPSQCGAPPCTKTTCPLAGANCGFVADGCGGILDCGGTAACTNPGEKCGGGGPNKCGAGTDGGGGTTCTNLCLKIPTDCPSDGGVNTTEITGTIYMPNGTLPVYDALVYVPNGTPDAVPTGVGTTCETCAAEASGAPLVNTHSDAKGRFTLTGIPYDAAGIPVVIQKGRWRKQITVSGLTRCGTKELSPTWPQAPTVNNTTFGATQTALNNIPKLAVTSGERDSLQCLLLKVGIDKAEFTQPNKTGRVNVFHGSGGTNRYDSNFNGVGTSTTAWAVGAQTTRALPDETYLYGDSAVGTVDSTKLKAYDGVVLSCTGTGDDRQAALGGYRAEMQDYADKGGHIFASHWHHSWLEYGVAPWGKTPGGFGPIATIDHQNDLVVPIPATINQAFTKGAALATWLVQTHTLDGTAASALGTVNIGTNNNDGAQHTIDAIDETRANKWISIASPQQCASGGGCAPNSTGTSTSPNASIQYFDFNTPVDQTTQCGRFVISDLHVATAPNNTQSFPTSNCGSGTAFTDQERVLAFMLFDLTSCIVPVQPPPPFQCQTLTCGQQGIACGKAGDGCGGQQDCAACPENQVCQGNPPACVTPSCIPRTCDQAGAECGTISNGCGGTVKCPDCAAGKICGGSGPNQCGSNSCTPTTCSAQGIQCGPAGNGCGGPLDCGPCPQGQTCGGGGQPGICGAPNCTPLTCAAANAVCGFVANGCGGLADCGPCPAGQNCGGGGIANQCGSPGGVN